MRDPQRIAAFQRATKEALSVLEHQLSRVPFVSGDRLTMADLPLGAAVHRYLNLGIDRPPFAHIEAWHAGLAKRSAFQTHVAFPFGRNPAEWYRLEWEGG